MDNRVVHHSWRGGRQRFAIIGSALASFSLHMTQSATSARGQSDGGRQERRDEGSEGQTPRAGDVWRRENRAGRASRRAENQTQKKTRADVVLSAFNFNFSFSFPLSEHETGSGEHQNVAQQSSN